MGKGLGQLSALAVARAKDGMHGDGGGLWLQVKGGARSWVFRYSFGGKRRYRGLGPTATLSLAEARDAAADCRKLLLSGVDPVEAARAERATAALEAAKAMTFGEAAAQAMAARIATWRNAAHKSQWQQNWTVYAKPVLGDVPVEAVDTTLVLRVVEPLWLSKHDTARKLRERLELILDWCKTRGLRTGDNPARWKGQLEHLLADPKAVRKVLPVRHHRALPYADLPQFMAELRLREGEPARALEFAVLTGSRTAEVVFAAPAEIDGDIWTVPAARMKALRPHRVPLCDRAAEIVAGRTGAWLFPGKKSGYPIAPSALTAVLRQMGWDKRTTVHGLARSTFKDWATDETDYARETIEAALAHTIGDKAEQAYRRTDAIEKRRRLMQAWSAYCCGKPVDAGGNVLLMKRSA